MLMRELYYTKKRLNDKSENWSLEKKRLGTTGNTIVCSLRFESYMCLTLYIAVTQFTYSKLRYCYVKS